MFGLLDMQEQVESALANMAVSLESSSASNILSDFTQLAAMIRQEVGLMLSKITSLKRTNLFDWHTKSLLHIPHVFLPVG